MRNPLFAHLILVIGLVSSGTVSARPFQPSDVTAEAQWILHVDLEAMKPAETGENDDSKRKRTQATSAAGKKSAAKDDGGQNGGENGGQKKGGT